MEEGTMEEGTLEDSGDPVVIDVDLVKAGSSLNGLRIALRRRDSKMVGWNGFESEVGIGSRFPSFS